MSGETINGNSGSEDSSLSNPWEEQVSGNPDDSTPDPSGSEDASVSSPWVEDDSAPGSFIKKTYVKDPEKALWMARVSEDSRRKQQKVEDRARRLEESDPHMARITKETAEYLERTRGQREKEAGEAYDAFSKYGGEPWARKLIKETYSSQKEEVAKLIEDARFALKYGEIDKGKSLAMEAAFQKTLYLIECGLMILKQAKKDEALKWLEQIENE